MCVYIYIYIYIYTCVASGFVSADLGAPIVAILSYYYYHHYYRYYYC